MVAAFQFWNASPHTIMSQADFGTPGPAPSALTFVSGVVRHQREYTDGYGELRHAALIASNEGGQRGVFEVFGPEPIGQVGKPIRVKCKVVGVPHSFKYTDEQTGERVQVRTAKHYLQAVAG